VEFSSKCSVSEPLGTSPDGFNVGRAAWEINHQKVWEDVDSFDEILLVTILNHVPAVST